MIYVSSLFREYSSKWFMFHLYFEDILQNDLCFISISRIFFKMIYVSSSFILTSVPFPTVPTGIPCYLMLSQFNQVNLYPTESILAASTDSGIMWYVRYVGVIPLLKLWIHNIKNIGTCDIMTLIIVSILALEEPRNFIRFCRQIWMTLLNLKTFVDSQKNLEEHSANALELMQSCTKP